MKLFLSISLCMFLSISLFSQGPLITEINHDNNYDQTDPFGIDSIEYVEVYINDPQPTDLTSFKIISYNEVDPNAAVPTGQAEVGFIRTLEDTLRTGKTPNGKYYIIEFPDSTYFGWPTAGIRDGEDGIALVKMGTPNIVHDFWRYKTCDPFTAIDGPAIGAVSDPITTDYSRTCGSSGVSLVQQNSALPTTTTLQQNGFGDWELAEETSRLPPFESNSNVPVDLMFFRVLPDPDYNFLSWGTAQEYNNDYFIVFHSRDGASFEEVAKVDGKGDYAGESYYDFRHYTQESGVHYYQIRQVDYDGKYEDFEIRSITIENQVDVEAIPSSTHAEFQLSNVENGELITVFDLTGRKVLQEAYNSTISISNFTNGLYFVHVHDQIIRIHKF